MEEETNTVYFIYIIFQKDPTQYKHIFYLTDFNPNSFYINDNFQFVEQFEYTLPEQLIAKKQYWDTYYNNNNSFHF